jgi:hypothetical protein
MNGLQRPYGEMRKIRRTHGSRVSTTLTTHNAHRTQTHMQRERERERERVTVDVQAAPELGPVLEDNAIAQYFQEFLEFGTRFHVVIPLNASVGEQYVNRND